MSPCPALVIVSAHVTPYRAHLFGRIAREIPELALHSFFVETGGELEWDLSMPAATHPRVFPRGGEGFGGGPRGFARLVSGFSEARHMLRAASDLDARAIVVGGYGRPSLLALLVLARRGETPVFLRADAILPGGGEPGRGRWLKDAVRRVLLPWLLRGVDGVLVMGRMGERWAEAWGVRRERVFRVPYEPDHARFARCDDDELAAFRSRHDLAVGRRRFLYVGRLATIKRVDWLVDSFVAVADDAAEWDLAIAGTGPLEASLRERVPARLRERVRFLGFLDEDGVRCALHACDALVLPSLREPWGVVVNEAVAAGRAVVANDACGAAHELVRDGVNGRIVPAGDRGALTTALADVAAPGRVEAMQRAAAGVLAEWAESSDPVAGLRAALTSAGALPVEDAATS